MSREFPIQKCFRINKLERDVVKSANFKLPDDKRFYSLETTIKYELNGGVPKGFPLIIKIGNDDIETKLSLSPRLGTSYRKHIVQLCGNTDLLMMQCDVGTFHNITMLLTELNITEIENI